MFSSEVLIPTLALWVLTLGSLWISGRSFRLRADPGCLPRAYAMVSGTVFWPLQWRRGYMLAIGGFCFAFSVMVVVLEIMLLTGSVSGPERYAIVFLIISSYWNLLESVFTREGIVFLPILLRVFGGTSSWIFRCVLVVGSFFQLLRASQWALPS